MGIVPIAAVLDFLNDNSGALTALLTLVLIAVTTAYVAMNWRMVGEMEKARQQALLPKLAIDFHAISPMHLVPIIRNVGPGAAFEVDVALVFDPLGDAPPVERHWRASVVAPGEQHQFISELKKESDPRAGDRPPEDYHSMRLVGSMKDALGEKHDVDEVFEDLAQWWDLKAGERFVDEPEKRLAGELSEKIGKPLIKAVQQLSARRS